MIEQSMGDAVTMREAAPADAVKRFRAGDEILGRYVVESELGQGGMGVVYLCLDKVGGVKVAVKGLPPDVSHNAGEMDEIRENFQLVCDLRHSEIAGVRTLEKDEKGDYYLVMDVAHGMNLKRWMRANRDAALEKKLAVLAEVASALDYAHSRKVMHRDIKPENVMIDEEDHVQILDFGLAARIRTSLSRVSMLPRSMSGTPAYKSPEQWRGQPQNAAADQYSLGVMAYEMIAGYLPFENDDVSLLRMAVLGEEVAAVPDVAPCVNAALARALSKNPGDRFASCSDFVTALSGGKVSAKKPSANVVKTAAEAGKPGLLGRKGVLAAAGVLVLLGVAVALFRGSVTGGVRKEADQTAVRNAALELKAKAGLAHEDAGKRNFADYPELTATLRTFNACYQSGLEAFAVGDYAAATNFFERTGAAMHAMSAEHRILEKRRAERQRQDEVRRKLDSGGYDAGKDSEGREVAIWVPGREVGGRMTSDREGVWMSPVDCPDCGGTGAKSHDSVCQACSGSGQVSGKRKCSHCGGSGKMQERQICSLCAGAGLTKPDCTAGCSEITRNGQVLFQHGFVCSKCNGSGTVANGAGLIGDLAGLAIGTAIAGKNYRPAPSSPSTITCSMCGGLGGYQCRTCSGTGSVQKKCYACRGVGSSVGSVDCLVCNGTGECSTVGPCTSCHGGKVSVSHVCERCSGNGRMWMEKTADAAERRYFPMAVWSPLGTWRANYEQTILEPDGTTNRASVCEALDCRPDGEFTRTRSMFGKTGKTVGKWNVLRGQLLLSVRKANGSYADTVYALINPSHDSFELRFSDVGNYERGLTAHGGTAVSSYGADGTLNTVLTRGGKVSRISQGAKVFRREGK